MQARKRPSLTSLNLQKGNNMFIFFRNYSYYDILMMNLYDIRYIFLEKLLRKRKTLLVETVLKKIKVN